tara:strand:- start:182 stop:625 length:444 start_codon:yes stop_codon:yes gene_type:complete
MKEIKTLKSYLLDATVMVLVAGIVYFGIQFLTPEPPYHSVTRVNIAPQQNNLIISANYVEGDCTFVTLYVYGVLKGRDTPLKWESLDGYSNFDLDRSSGKRHLVLKVKTDKVRYETIEVVTEHYCPHGVVAKTFLEENLGNFMFYNP